MFVVPENLVRRPGVEDGQVGAVLRDGLELIRQASTGPLAPHAREAIVERFGHGFGLGFAGLSGQLGREPFRFRIAYIQGHINTCRLHVTV